MLSDCASLIRPTCFAERHSNPVRFLAYSCEHALAFQSVGGSPAAEEEVGRRGPHRALAAERLRPLHLRYVAGRVVEVGAHEIKHCPSIVRLEPAEAQVEFSRRPERHVAGAQAPVEAGHLDEVKPRVRTDAAVALPALAAVQAAFQLFGQPLPAARLSRRQPEVAHAGRADVEAVNGRRCAPAASRRRHRTSVGRPGTGAANGASSCRGAARAERVRPPEAAPPGANAT